MINEVQTPPANEDGRPSGLSVSTGYRLLCASKEHALKSPACPYCGGKLRFSINGSEQEEDGSWVATDLDVNCDSEPDIDGPDWQGWWDDHSSDYCHKWHDLHERLVRDLRRTHRVDFDNVPSEPLHE